MSTYEQLPGVILDERRLTDLASELRAQYREAQPWPHVAVEGLFPDDAIASAAEECIRLKHEQLLTTRGRNQMKQESSVGLGPASTQLLATLESPAFRSFLEEVTAVSGLQSDPTHALGGMHRSPPGAFTLIHRDFRRHPVTNLYHRVNVLLYLNEGWQDAWGGALELWPSNMKSVGRRIAPRGNTMVIFETHDQTLHGLPTPVACPAGNARVSLASYWYTEQPRDSFVERRRAVFARRPHDSWRVGRRRPIQVVKDLLRPNRSFF